MSLVRQGPRVPVDITAREGVPRPAGRRLRGDPQVTPPRGSRPFLEQQRQSVTGPNVSITLARFRVPPHMVAIIREITYQVNDVVTSTDITFRLRSNDSSVTGYVYALFPRAASHVSVEFDPYSTYVPISDGAEVDVRVTVVDIGMYLVGATLRGWVYPGDLETQYQQGEG